MTIVGLFSIATNTPPWMKHAACREAEEPDLFFPDKEGPVRSAAAAKRICAQCPVRAQNVSGTGENFGGTGECLEYAIVTNQVGVWGGMSDRERKEFKRLRSAPTKRVGCGTPSGVSMHYRHSETPCRACLDAASANTRRKREQHGTSAGYRRHYRRGEKPCPACVEGAQRRRRERRAAPTGTDAPQVAERGIQPQQWGPQGGRGTAGT